MKRTILFLSLIAGIKSLANHEMDSYIEATHKKVEKISAEYSDKVNDASRDLPFLARQILTLSREEKANILDNIAVEEWKVRALKDRFETRYQETGCASVESQSCKQLSESLREFERITDEFLSIFVGKARSIVEQSQTRQSEA